MVKNRNMYSEVFELLKNINREDLKNIPIGLLETIKENKNDEYIPNINYNDINSSLSQESRALYIWIYLTYILKDDEEKSQIYEMLQKNEIEKQETIKINENMFNKIQKEIPKDNQKVDLIVKTNKSNIFVRILNKIRFWLKSKWR